jgi:plastocyanin
MNRRARRTAPLALPAVLLLIVLGGCGSDDSPNAPNPSTLETFDSGTLAPNQEYTRTFGTTPGSYGYRCKFHSGMSGTVVVNASGVDSAHVDIKDNFFDPASVTVKPGGKVNWENKGVVNHSATRP